MRIIKWVIALVAVILIVFIYSAVFNKSSQQYSVEAFSQTDGVNASFTNAISYQGRLLDGGQPANGTYDLGFDLYGVVAGGVLIDSVSQTALDVTDGLFMTTLSFDEGSFNGGERWLEIRAKKSTDSEYVTLVPRQQILPVPYALYASGGDPTVLQQRVSGTCEDGGMVTTINQDGSVECNPADERPVHQTLALADVSMWSDQSISTAIGIDGLAVLGYCTGANGERDLEFIHCNDISCTSFSKRVIDSDGDVCYGTSVAIGADGFPLISYFDHTGTNLKAAHCNDITCDSSSISILEDTNNPGYSSSLAIGTDGLGLISYWEAAASAKGGTLCKYSLLLCGLHHHPGQYQCQCQS